MSAARRPEGRRRPSPPFPPHRRPAPPPRPPPLLRRQDLVARRQAAAARVLQRDGSIDELEGELGGPTQQRLDVLGIVDPRQLDEDAVCSLALDRRLLGTGL